MQSKTDSKSIAKAMQLTYIYYKGKANHFSPERIERVCRLIQRTFNESKLKCRRDKQPEAKTGRAGSKLVKAQATGDEPDDLPSLKTGCTNFNHVEQRRSLIAKRYPEKVLVPNPETEVSEKDDKAINTKRTRYKQHDFTKIVPIILPPTSVAPPSTRKDPVEQRMSNKLAVMLGGIREAANPSGRVDVLTKLYVIEVKKACNWKHGIGQALVYQFYYPDKKPVLFLFGEDVDLYRDLAAQHCDRQSVLYREESQQIPSEF